MLSGNLVNFGNFDQCLNIKHQNQKDEHIFNGKYCLLAIMLKENSTDKLLNSNITILRDFIERNKDVLNEIEMSNYMRLISVYLI